MRNIFFIITAFFIICSGCVHAYDSVEIGGIAELSEVSQSGYIPYSFGLDDNEEEKEVLLKGENTLPSKYDSRDYGYITSVKNQGSEGCCWAFSSIGAIEANLIKKGLISTEDADYSEAHAAWFGVNSYDNKYKDGRIVDDPYNSGGNDWYFRSMITKRSGLEMEYNSPYSERSVMKEIQRFASNVRLKNSMVYDLSEEDALKNAIKEYGAVTYGLYYSRGYLNNNTAYNCPVEKVGNHEVLLIGWDDEYPAENFKDKPSRNGAWIAKNSYGESFGQNGYFMISYENESIGTYASAYDAVIEDYDNIYMYDGSGCNGWVSLNGNNRKPLMANVFTAENDELLSAVSFYTYAGTGYEIRIYKGNPLNDGIEYEEARTSGNVSREGYYTIELNDKVELQSGDVFTAVVIVDAGVKIPVEYVGGSGFNVSYEEGQSIIGEWIDGSVREVSASAELGNTSVKAFTDDITSKPKDIKLKKIKNIINKIQNSITAPNGILLDKIKKASSLTLNNTKSEMENTRIELLTEYERASNNNYIVTSEMIDKEVTIEAVLLDENTADSIIAAFYDEKGTFLKTEIREYQPGVDEYIFNEVPDMTNSYKIMLWRDGIIPCV